MMSISNRDGNGAREAKGVGGKRRQRSVEEKRRIAEETLKPGASVVHPITRIKELVLLRICLTGAGETTEAA